MEEISYVNFFIDDVRFKTPCCPLEDTLKEELDRLIALQDVDVEVKRIKDDINSLPRRIEDIERRFSESVKEDTALENQLNSALTAKKQLESNLEAEQQKHKKFKADQMKATNQREYEVTVREIDVATKAISSLETEILKLMEQIEKLDSKVKESKPEIEARRSDVEKQLDEWNATSNRNQQALDRLIEKRSPLLALLSLRTKSEYERLSKRGIGSALSQVVNSSCISCRMTIRPQVCYEIRKGESIIHCENCDRILYYRAEAAYS